MPDRYQNIASRAVWKPVGDDVLVMRGEPKCPKVHVHMIGDRWSMLWFRYRGEQRCLVGSGSVPDPGTAYKLLQMAPPNGELDVDCATGVRRTPGKLVHKKKPTKE